MNDVTNPIISISCAQSINKEMAEPTEDEVLAAQGLLELSRVNRRFYDTNVSVFSI